MSKKGLDYSKFKKISCDDKSAVMQHPDGHKITVVMSKLSPQMRKQMQELPLHKAAGGRVQNYDVGGAVFHEDQSKQQQPNPAPAAQPTIVINNTPAQPAPTLPGPVQVAPPVEPPPAPQAMEPTPMPNATPAAPEPEPTPSATPAPLPGGGVTPEQFQKVQEQFAPKMPQAKPDLPTPPPATNPYMQQLQSMQPSQLGSYGTNLSGGLALQERAARQAYTAAAALGQAQEQAAKEKQLELEAHERNRQLWLQSAESEINNLRDDIRNSHVNPSRFLENMDTGSKVMTAIGVLFSGMGSSLLGQQNMVLDYLNKQIDRDIKAQEKNIDNKHSLLRHNIDIFQNKEKALAVTKAQIADIYATKIEQASGRFNTANAAAIRDNVIGQLRAQNAMNLAMAGQADQGGDEEGNIGAQIRMLHAVGKGELAKDIESKYLPGHGTTKVALNDKDREELRKAQEYMHLVKGMKDSVQKMSTMGKLTPAAFSKEKTKLESQARIAQSLLRESALGTVYKESEQPLLNQIIPEHPASIMESLTVIPKLEQELARNQEQMKLHLESKGFRPFKNRQPSGHGDAQQRPSSFKPKSR